MNNEWQNYEKARLAACGPRIHAGIAAIAAFAAEIDKEVSNPALAQTTTSAVRALLSDLLWGAWALGYEYRCEESATEEVGE